MFTFIYVPLVSFLDGLLWMNNDTTAALQSVLLKALPPVCMKYTARGESRVANIARGEAECYICHETLTKSCIFHTNRVSVL